MKSICLLITLGCVALVNCLPSATTEPTKPDNVTTPWDDNLPPSALTEEQIKAMIKEIDESLNEDDVKGNATDALKRMRRGTPRGDNTHWCCNKEDPGQTGPKRAVIKARIVRKTVPQGGRIKCGLFGWKRCGTTRTVVITVTEYYTDYEYPTIPAPEWTNGCPDKNIVCCNGYVYYPNLKNCLTFVQLEAILTVINNNIGALGALNDFLQG